MRTVAMWGRRRKKAAGGLRPAAVNLTDLKRELDELVAAAEFRATGDGDAASLQHAADAFINSGPELLSSVTPFLWEYYLDDWDDADSVGAPLDPSVNEIWAEVVIKGPPVVTIGGHRLTPAASYLSFAADVSWEPEHGLQLVFEDGVRVCKVGPYDGHVTNAGALNDESLLGIVFAKRGTVGHGEPPSPSPARPAKSSTASVAHLSAVNGGPALCGASYDGRHPFLLITAEFRSMTSAPICASCLRIHQG